jgi:hypothetical protein
MTKEVGYKQFFIFTSIGVFPLIKFSPINTHMYRLLLGRGGVSLESGSFWVRYYGSGPTKFNVFFSWVC